MLAAGGQRVVGHRWQFLARRNALGLHPRCSLLAGRARGDTSMQIFVNVPIFASMCHCLPELMPIFARNRLPDSPRQHLPTYTQSICQLCCQLCCQLFANSLPTLYQLCANSLPTLCQLFDNSLPTCAHTAHRQTTCCLQSCASPVNVPTSVNCQPCANQQLLPRPSI